MSRFVPGLPAHPVHLGAATLLRVSAEGLGTALVLVVQARTGQAATAGFIQAAIMLPYVLTGPVTGHALDRTPRPRALALTMTAGYLLAAALLLLTAGRVPLLLALAFAVMIGCTEPVVVALTGLLPRFVPEHRLTWAYGLEAATYNIASIAGPGLAAALTAAVGAGYAGAAVVGCTLIGMTFLSALAIPPPGVLPAADRHPKNPGPAGTGEHPDPAAAEPAEGRAEDGGSSGPAAATAGRPDLDVAEATATADPKEAAPGGPTGREAVLDVLTGGLVVLLANPVLRAVTVATTLAFLGMGAVAVTAVLFAEHLGKSAGVGGQLIVAFAVGSLIGSLGSARWLSARRAEWVLMAGMVAFGVVLAAVAWAPSLPWALAGFVLAGVCDGPVFAATLTVRQREAPADRLGQVNTTGGSLKIGSAALGAALAGALAEPIGATGLLLGMAALQFAGAAFGVLVLLPALRRR